MEAITTLFCDIWNHLSTYKERYIIIAAVFMSRSIFKYLLQTWAIRMEYEIRNTPFWDIRLDSSVTIKYMSFFQQLTKYPFFRNKFQHSENRNLRTDLKIVQELLLKDLGSRNLWSLFTVQCILWKVRRFRG